MPGFSLGAGERDFIFAAQDRVDGIYDRIRCVRTKRFKYILNFYPEFPWRQHHVRGSYNFVYLPVATLMEVLHAQGKLTPQQSQFMARRRPVEELYDLANDPHELNNLATDTNHQTILRDLRAALDRWIEETGDMGETPEDARYRDRIYRQWAATFDEWFRNTHGISPDVSPAEYLRHWEQRLAVAPE